MLNEQFTLGDSVENQVLGVWIHLDTGVLNGILTLKVHGTISNWTLVRIFARTWILLTLEIIGMPFWGKSKPKSNPYLTPIIFSYLDTLWRFGKIRSEIEKLKFQILLIF